MVTGIDFVTIPTQDPERSRAFYVDTLGFRPDENARFDLWAGETCFVIWAPESMGWPFGPQENGTPALRVDDVAGARAELEGKGVEFQGETIDTGVCHIALFSDPDGNSLMLHRRYASYD